MPRRFVPVLVLAAAFALVGLATPGTAGPAEEPAAPFTPGETLTYDLSWQIFPAGQIVATLVRFGEPTQDSYEVKATAQSRGFVSLLYNVQDEFDSFFNPSTSCSESITKRINEGRRHKNTRIVFDRTRKLAVLDERDLAGKDSPAKHDENQIPACVQDVVSAFYFVRRQPLRVGREVTLPVNDGTKTADVRVEVQALETIRTPLGTRSAFRVEPTVLGGLMKRKVRMQIWFSDDAERLPLRIKAMMSIGTLTAELKSMTAGPASAPSQPKP